MSLPVIDVSPLVTGAGDVGGVARVARELARACEESGFFYVAGHGIEAPLFAELERAARTFFALPEAAKMQVAMARGGRAWRGYFPVGRELTSGEPDAKEGLYFGEELGPTDPRVLAGLPLHGANLWPREVPALRDSVHAYLDRLTALAHALMRGISMSLSLPPEWFAEHYTREPIVLFRIFHYPPRVPGWGVGEHTDYGLLTLLLQDAVAGLEVKTRAGWISAPPIPGTFVCNLGDMLDRLTRGRYRSTPHRVANRSDTSRLSYAFFFDPAWDAALVPVPAVSTPDASNPTPAPRWDGADVHTYSGTYGDYLVQKVARVFPELATVLEADPAQPAR